MPFLTLPDSSPSVKLFYTDDGPTETQACLLVHGWACDSHDWSFQIPPLRRLGHRVIAFDQRGHGRSTAPEDLAAYSIQAFVDDAVALVKHLEVKELILFGHSMGTVISSMLAVQHPDLVKALVLVHPIYAGTPPALKTTRDAMLADLDRATEIALPFFDQYMWTPRSPEWLKTWVNRRVLGTSNFCAAGCVVGMTSDRMVGVVGKSDECKDFHRKKGMRRPRLVLTGMKGVIEWEQNIGLGGGDECVWVDEGTFLHIADWEKVNGIIEGWLATHRTSKSP